MSGEGAADEPTLRFYSGNAQACGRERTRHTRLARFLELLPVGGKILELGCGAGDDFSRHAGRRLRCPPTDGSPEMADEASRRLGRPVETLLFHDLDEIETYDGIWANAMPSSRPEARAFCRCWRGYGAR